MASASSLVGPNVLNGEKELASIAHFADEEIHMVS
jgi:hypothetical protein